MKYTDAVSFFEEQGQPDIERFVDINLAITEQVYTILEKKGWNQKDLAREMGKKESEMSRWLSGMHNLTLKSISKLETVLGETIILTPQQAREAYERTKYIYMKAEVVRPNAFRTAEVDYPETVKNLPDQLLGLKLKIA